jgi:hypothetical protein
MQAMQMPKTMPIEDMNGVVGWTIYLVGALLLILAVGWLGFLALRFWSGTLAAITHARNRGGRALGRPREKVAGVGVTLVLGLLVCIFVRVIVFQTVQSARFDNHGLELIYRWSWLNQSIPYNSILRAELVDDPPFFMLPGARPQRGMPLKIILTTRLRIFEIEAGSSELSDRMRAVYDEIEKHSTEFAQG